jgi:hypothetical protein
MRQIFFEYVNVCQEESAMTIRINLRLWRVHCNDARLDVKGMRWICSGFAAHLLAIFGALSGRYSTNDDAQK